jgi:hypothetical protein
MVSEMVANVNDSSEFARRYEEPAIGRQKAEKQVDFVRG